jgi:hypothetical protein
VSRKVILKRGTVVKRTVFGEGNVLIDGAVFVWYLLQKILAVILSRAAVYRHYLGLSRPFGVDEVDTIADINDLYLN